MAIHHYLPLAVSVPTITTLMSLCITLRTRRMQMIYLLVRLLAEQNGLGLVSLGMVTLMC